MLWNYLAAQRWLILIRKDKSWTTQYESIDSIGLAKDRTIWNKWFHRNRFKPHNTNQDCKLKFDHLKVYSSLDHNGICRAVDSYFKTSKHLWSWRIQDNLSIAHHRPLDVIFVRNSSIWANQWSLNKEILIFRQYVRYSLNNNLQLAKLNHFWATLYLKSWLFFCK